MRSRQRRAEWMDDSRVAPGDLQAALDFLRFVNRWLNGTGPSARHLLSLARDGDSVLDIATGGGDAVHAVARAAARRGLRLYFTGVDMHPLTVRVAKRCGIRAGRADARRLPFPDGSFDFAHCSTFLHHLDEEGAIQALREMDRVARRGVVVNDLLRRRRALAWITLFTAAARPITRHDARASVRAAWRHDEVLDLVRRAGLGYLRFHPHFGHRFCLVGQKA